jgi:hypothetical protein
MMTLTFSLIIIGLFIADIFFVEYEKFGWTTICITASAAIVWYSNLWGIFDTINNNCKFSLELIVAYVIVGIGWSFIKWFSYLLSYRDKFLKIKNEGVKLKNGLIKTQYEWSQTNGKTINGNPISKEALPFDYWNLRELLNDFCADSGNNRQLYNQYNDFKSKYENFSKPIASDNKAKIVAWICYWPWSLVGTFINDPLRRFVEFMFRSLRALYQRMSDKIFTDFPDKL